MALVVGGGGLVVVVVVAAVVVCPATPSVVFVVEQPQGLQLMSLTVQVATIDYWTLSFTLYSDLL